MEKKINLLLDEIHCLFVILDSVKHPVNCAIQAREHSMQDNIDAMLIFE
jgi:hypothetical protein